jgi:hypothetical protein
MHINNIKQIEIKTNLYIQIKKKWMMILTI